MTDLIIGKYTLLFLFSILFLLGAMIGYGIRAKVYSKREVDLITRLNEEKLWNYRLELEKSWLTENPSINDEKVSKQVTYE